VTTTGSAYNFKTQEGELTPVIRSAKDNIQFLYEVNEAPLFCTTIGIECCSSNPTTFCYFICLFRFRWVFKLLSALSFLELVDDTPVLPIPPARAIVGVTIRRLPLDVSHCTASWTPAPLSIKIRTVSTCPATLARARSVLLLLSRCSRLAPRSNKSRTVLQCPFLQATRSGVDPWQSPRSTWQPRSNNSCTLLFVICVIVIVGGSLSKDARWEPSRYMPLRKILFISSRYLTRRVRDNSANGNAGPVDDIPVYMHILYVMRRHGNA
jgi:hypothetical protein